MVRFYGKGGDGSIATFLKMNKCAAHIKLILLLSAVMFCPLLIGPGSALILAPWIV